MTASAGSPSAPTNPDLDAAINEAVQTAQELKKTDQAFAELQPQVADWKARLQAHNSERCTYPEGNPGACQWYTDRAAALNAERDRLRAGWENLERQERALITRLGILKARIRITAAIAYNCNCGALPPEHAKACWSSCFDGSGDRRLRSCLDMDISTDAGAYAFASCLLPRTP